MIKEVCVSLKTHSSTLTDMSAIFLWLSLEETEDKGILKH